MPIRLIGSFNHPLLSLFRPPPTSPSTTDICKPSLSLSPPPLYIRSLFSPTSMDRSQIYLTSQQPHQHQLLPTATVAAATNHLTSPASPRRPPSVRRLTFPHPSLSSLVLSSSVDLPSSPSHLSSPFRLSFQFSPRLRRIASSDGRNNVNARSSGNILITITPNSPIFARLERLVVGDSVLGEDIVDWGMFPSWTALNICVIMNETVTTVHTSFTGFFNFKLPIFLLLNFAIVSGVTMMKNPPGDEGDDMREGDEGDDRREGDDGESVEEKRTRDDRERWRKVRQRTEDGRRGLAGEVRCLVAATAGAESSLMAAAKDVVAMGC